MAIVNYNGSIGSFIYDDNEFSVCTDERGEFLHYKGREIDGNLINVPDGIVDGKSLFENTDIVSQPKLPVSLKNMDYMFMGCENMIQAGDIPEGVESSQSAYSYCTKLEYGAYMPDSIKHGDFMYDGCTSMVSAGHISNNLQTADGMFAGCGNLTETPQLPSSVQSQDSAFLNCDRLPESIEFDNDEEYDYDEMFGDMEDVSAKSEIEAENIESNVDGLVREKKNLLSKKAASMGIAVSDRSRDIDIQFSSLISGQQGPDFGL